MAIADNRLENESDESLMFYTLRTRDFIKQAYKQEQWEQRRSMLLIMGYRIPFDADKQMVDDLYYNLRKAIYPGRSGGIA